MECLTKKRKILRTQVTCLLDEWQEKFCGPLMKEDLSIMRDRLHGLREQVNAVDTNIQENISKQDYEAEVIRVCECNDRITTCLVKFLPH